ncbi:MAG: DNA-packaging protein [Oscillospiraceae bacterium]
MIVNQKELAQCLGISTRQVRNLKSDGMFVHPQNAKGYQLENCIQEYIDFKINAEMGRSASVSKERIQAEHEEVKKQISELRLRKLRRELHEAADVESFLSDMLIKFKNRLTAIPSKLAVKISGEKDITQIEGIIRDELYQTLEELSEYDPEKIDGQVMYEDESFDEEEGVED